MYKVAFHISEESYSAAIQCGSIASFCQHAIKAPRALLISFVNTDNASSAIDLVKFHYQNCSLGNLTECSLFELKDFDSRDWLTPIYIEEAISKGICSMITALVNA